MTRKTKYYNLTETTGSNYSSSQTNILEISRLLQNKPYWRQPFGNVLEKKKTLLLNIPNILNRPFEESVVIAEQLYSLQQEGFDLYFYGDGNFTKFKIPMDTMAGRDSIEIISDKKLSELAAKQLQLSHDELFVINEMELMELIQSPQEDLVSQANQETVNLSRTNISGASLIELIKTPENRVRHLNLSHCINLDACTVPEDLVMEHLEELIIQDEAHTKNEYAQVFSSSREFQRVNNLNPTSITNLLKSSPSLKSLTLGRCYTPIQDRLHEFNFSSLEQLNLNNSRISSAALGRLLKDNTLKELHLNTCPNLDDNLPDDLKMSSLERLDLSNSSVTNEFLSKILPTATNIKELNLLGSQQCNITQLPFNLFKIPAIEKMALSNIQSVNILFKTPKLKELVLNKCTLKNETEIEYVRLDSLERLEITDSQVSSEFLGQILTIAPNLKELVLKNCPSIAKIDNLKLDSLERLEVNNSIGGGNFLRKILAIAPQIKEINVLNCKDFSLRSLNAPSIEKIKLSHAEIENVKALLLNSPNLKELILDNSILRGHDFLPDEELNLSSLEHLSISIDKKDWSNGRVKKFQINSHSLDKILASSPNLKTLHLQYFGSLQENLTSNLHFASLETLSLKGTHLNTHSLGIILAGSPKLVTLDLDYISPRDGDLVNPLNLSSVEHLYLNSSKINSRIFSVLLASAPNLKHIEFEICRSLPDGWVNTAPLLTLETLKLDLANTSAVSLNSMLAHAPNLKILNLRNATIKQDSLASTSILSLPSLEELDLAGAIIEPRILSTIFSASPNLRTLKATGKIVQQNCMVINGLSFPSLETLDLAGSHNNALFLEKILATVPKLKEIKLNKSTLIGDLTEIPNLPYVERINFEQCTINCLSLKNLLGNAPKLKELDLTKCKINGRLELSENQAGQLQLDSLAKLSLREFHSNNVLFADLISNTPSLKELGISSGEFTGTTMANLPVLERMDLADSTLNTNALSALFVGSPKLQQLNLEMCTIKGNDLPDHLNLTSLKTLDLRNTEINPELIKKILAAAPQVKIINYDPSLFHSRDVEQSAAEKPDIKENPINKDTVVSTPPLYSANTTVTKASDTPLISEEKLDHVDKPSPASQAHTGTNQQKMDANTQFNPNQQFDLTRIFYTAGNKHPEPAEYRLTIFNDILYNKSPGTASEAFTLSNTRSDPAIKPCIIPQSTTDLKTKLPTKAIEGEQHYYGIQKLNITNQWQSLGSLAAHEEITQFHLSHPVDLEWGYSQRDNLYYIRQKKDSVDVLDPITIDFLITVPSTNPVTLPRDMQQKIKECREFTANPLKLNDTHLTGIEFLNALETQKVGACRHRSLVFKAWMDSHHPELPTRIVNNDCHSFIEVLYKNQWVTCDLGGYPSKVVIQEPLLPEPTVAMLTEDGIIESASPESPLIKTKYFQSEHVAQENPGSTPLYMEHLLSANGNKKLIRVPNQQHLNGFRYHLQQYCNNTSRPCFYIHSPEDLICSAPFIKKEGTQGTLKKGPGGPLHDFLMAHHDDGSKPLLIVNYDRFSSSEIVRFNALLDKERFADGTPLPLETQIVGLMNPDKPGAYEGADFRSRFDAILKSPLTEPQLAIPALTEELKPEDASQRINLYDGADWEDRLLGHWIMQGQNLHFIKGELLVALEQGKTHIELNNAPWTDEGFVAFWQEALLKGSFDTQGERYVLPEGFKLSKAQDYSFKETSKYLRINEQEQIPEGTLVLNNALLSRFFGLYQCNSQKGSIQYQEGLLAQHKGKELDLYLSDSISLTSWSLLLDTCKAQEVHLNLSVAPGVALPMELGITLPKKNRAPTPAWQGSTSLTSCVIQSTDVDVSLHSLKEDCLIIDVSEVSPADLLLKLDGSFDANNLSFKFTHQEGALLKALQANKTVVLKGVISKELKENLSELMLHRQQQDSPPGRILIISEQADLFPMLPSFKHSVTPAEKKALITHQFSQAQYEKHSLTELNAMAHYLALHPNKPAANAWQGLSHLPPSQLNKKLDLNDTSAQAAAFNQERLVAVEKGLQQSPFVFLAGKTGVGKTTFIHEVWQKEHEALHIGEESIKAWALDSRPGIKTLFIDEANISTRQWSEFEGLFHNPPRILIGNELLELSPEHKVIFAGNPLSYGGERQLPSLFARHGNSIIFEPMTPAYLYEELIRPIFNKSNLNSQELAVPILEVAHYLSTLDPDKSLITPRELSMMALLTLSFCTRNPKANPVEVAQYYAYTLAKGFVPEQAHSSFASLFNKVNSLPRNQNDASNKVLLTATNSPAFLALTDALDLRDLRQKQVIQASGGLGGIIIEGEPGLGKTELIIQTLLAQGMKKGNLTKEHPDEAVFYVLPISMAFEEKTQILLKAFHEGAVVFIDEINSAPMMERLLNDLLMGKDPQGCSAHKPGFMVIGAQNPASMAGRNRASSALEHRLQKVIIAEYPENEMIAILMHKGLPEKISQEMVSEYLTIREKALQNSSPTLCFRDVLKRAEQEITALEKRHHNKEKQENATQGTNKLIHRDNFSFFKTKINNRIDETDEHSDAFDMSTPDKKSFGS